MTQKVLLTWSGGKDSTLALWETQIGNAGLFKIEALLTIITVDYDRISMHGVRRELLEQQVNNLGYDLKKVFISKDSSNEEYDSKMNIILNRYRANGINGVVFGDIFLEDVRKYRETNLSKVGMKCIFPLWQKDTALLAQEFINLGFKAIVTCVDTTMLDGKFVGREFNEQFVYELPLGVDPCGENGEFHTFVHDGPIFRKKVEFFRGEVVLRDDRFYYCDLLPVQ